MQCTGTSNGVCASRQKLFKAACHHHQGYKTCFLSKVLSEFFSSCKLINRWWHCTDNLPYGVIGICVTVPAGLLPPKSLPPTLWGFCRSICGRAVVLHYFAIASTPKQHQRKHGEIGYPTETDKLKATMYC